MSSMIKVERGIQWSLEDCFYGNKEKKREPIKELVEEVNKYPGLKDIIFSINGLISRRGQHASGVYLFNKEGFMNYNALMRSPNGSLTTQFDMEDSDYQGCLKYDNLSTEATDKIRKTLDLLLEYGYIEDKGSLKETYNFYLHPDKLDYETKTMWAELSNNEIIDAFQMNTAVGQDALKKIKPTNLVELAHVSSLMRLMGEKGKINPIDKYVSYKNDINLWYSEMNKYNLSEQEQRYFEQYLLKYFGVAATQEDVMRICMDKNLCGLSLKEANKVRKAIAKKKASMIDEIKELVKSKCRNSNIFNYIWSEIISPQLGYSFSINHTTPYAIICIQEMNLYHNFPHVFWNCACLTTSAAKAVEEDAEEIREMIREGYDEIEFSEEDDDDGEGKKKKASSSNYDKIAIAIGEIKSKGITVDLPDINKSMLEFTPDVERNTILYGMKGITNVSDELINVIIENRPYNSFKDFKSKVKTTKTVLINLIKAGCFDAIDEDRVSLMKKYIIEVSKPKATLNLRNFQALNKYNLLPNELNDCKYAFVMNKLLKEHKKDDCYFIITEDLFPYFENQYGSDYIEIVDNESCIHQKVWDKNIYQVVMSKARDYIKMNIPDLLDKYNKILFDEEWNKYCLGSLSKWEMDSVSFYFSQHELGNVNLSNYGISHFKQLEAEPTPIRFFKYYPIYEIHQIAGTVLGKNKIKSTITILDADGSVITVKFRKEYFNIYDKQLSEKREDGTKKVIEKSWFKRGNKLVIAGYRKDKDFIPKTYSSTPFKTLYNIVEIDNNNRLSLRECRIGDDE